MLPIDLKRKQELLHRHTGVPLEVLSGVDDVRPSEDARRRLLDTLQRLEQDQNAPAELREQAGQLVFYFFDRPRFRRLVDVFKSPHNPMLRFWAGFFQDWQYAI